jgi:transposase InsO family protein
MKDLTPKDHAEAVATFRHAVIGPVCARELSHGDLAEALREIASTRVRPPGATLTKTYSVPTLERWLYAYRRGGLSALRPRGRNDRGRGRGLTPELRQLLCDIRREHPSASARLIVRTLEADGRLEVGVLKPGTLRKLLRQAGLDRVAVRDGSGPKTRLRWQAAAPDALWHGDVCHGPTLRLGGVRTPLRIHGMLDDCSRFVVALEAHASEREEDMLRVLIRALRLHGKPDALFLDNGATYRGDVLRTACSRLGISLIHARPYDPEARGKMERFWRTLREGCLDHLGEVGSLAEINQRLALFLERHYHSEPHAGLIGRAPLTAYAPSERLPNRIDEGALREALAVRERRRVRRDTTVSVLGRVYELEQGFLAGRVVDVVYSYLDDPPQPDVEHEGKRYRLSPVDPVANSRRRRPDRVSDGAPSQSVSFDPGCIARANDGALDTADEEQEEDLDEIF